MADKSLGRRDKIVTVGVIFLTMTSGAAIASLAPAQVDPAAAAVVRSTVDTPIAATLPIGTTPTTVTAQISSTQQICKTQTALGSRLGKRRVCRTPSEWELIRRDAQKAIDARQRMNSGGRSKDGG